MAPVIRCSNALALAIIVLCASIYYVTIWNPSMRRASAKDNVPVVVAERGVIDLFGVTWRMRRATPEIGLVETGRTPLNGQIVAFVFEREFQGGGTGELSRKGFKCAASLFDDQAREWSRRDLELPAEVSNWIDNNGYSETCYGKAPATNYVLIAAVPKDAQLRGVDLSFGESGKVILTARFMLS
ncbi:hypothetical protein IUQ79_10365 [Mycobacteroides abscessus subsp. bolletii]|uniref:hypothetical protein n=1 Tax=Mycobacteroides abscessus TaxID=36809 RepID=UPI0019D26BE4|nr:hypothetical protein [Mycobacteroides abscessus]MBN7302301.1 hypothetical protein [Mycobacteroides abscessus subsp. bolletii]